MIRTESEYKTALQDYQADREVIERQKAEFREMGFSAEEVATLIEPTLSFQAQLGEEISWYENVRRGTFSPVKRLTEIGTLLIGLRIARGITQEELAKRLGVNQSAVSRDERNEYHGITLERAQKVLDALQATVTFFPEEPITPLIGRETVSIP